MSDYNLEIDIKLWVDLHRVFDGARFWLGFADFNLLNVRSSGIPSSRHQSHRRLPVSASTNGTAQHFLAFPLSQITETPTKTIDSKSTFDENHPHDSESSVTAVTLPFRVEGVDAKSTLIVNITNRNRTSLGRCHSRIKDTMECQLCIGKLCYYREQKRLN
eukprot:gene8509-975_t